MKRCGAIGFAISSSTMARLIARGKYIFAGEDKFYARGVSYGPFQPNSRGERYPEPERAAGDFALMRELGVNVVRTYVPPPDWMFELGAECGLKLMVGIPWPFHMAFLDSREMTRDIRKAVRTVVADTRRYGDAIFAYILGNEIRSDIVRWHGARRVSRFLNELYDIGKQVDSEGLFTYANYPSTEYIELNFLDLICFNVYLHKEPDYRRYLTHLMATSGDRPLVLSETGMDTIREGEEHQAGLLGWQSRAAFELGLSGFIVFAFTDEWHTGGAEITDWAFGLVTRERVRKRACSAVAQVFNSALPPPLARTPKVSIVVAAYNAQATLAACLSSLKELDYPDRETIVVDDGSTDSTADIAESAGVPVLRLEHRGLAAARNAGAQAASGEVIAFIDADAIADRNWLYHLVECMIRREAVAAGGPNFPPPATSATAAASAAAPGAPREVPSAEDRLAQLCGCNMAVEKSALDAIGGFDTAFIAAGDDVDLSWRLLERGGVLAYAPGAVVMHERRQTLSAYVDQQRSYGRGEGLLFRKYPKRRSDSVYGGGWLWPWQAGRRIYYGAFGRGLFQSIYPAAESWIAEAPLTFPWMAVSLVLIVAGVIDPVFGALGLVGMLCSLASAGVSAAIAPLDPRYPGVRTRATLAAFDLLGPLVRSFERVRGRSCLPAIDEAAADVPPKFSTHGWIKLPPVWGDSVSPVQRDILIEAMRAALIRRGLAVATSDGFEPFDLEIFMTPTLKIPLNAIAIEPGRIALRWRLRLDLLRVAAILGPVMLLLLATGQPWGIVFAVPGILALAWAARVVPRIRLIGGLLEAAASEAAASLRTPPTVVPTANAGVG
jgi:GT2 family glycosyltransferase